MRNKTLRFFIIFFLILFFFLIINLKLPENYFEGGKFLSILPPLIAISLAIILREVYLSLIIGVFSGFLLLTNFKLYKALELMLTDGFVKNLADFDHSSIILFTLFLGGMVGIIYKNGGMEGLVLKLKKFAKTRRSAQVYGWIMGIVIFFDDYANTLLVGNTLRPLTDSYKISREKLSYIVDSTAAPVTSIAIISTWIGYEISLISDSFKNLGITENPYLFFIKTIPYRFYPIFCLFFGFLVAYSLRDFGPMHKAEKRAYKEGKVIRDGSNPLGFSNTEKIEPSSPLLGIIPIIFVFFSCFGMLYITGVQNLGHFSSIKDVISASDSFKSLTVSSFLGLALAFFLSLFKLKIKDVIDGAFDGFKAMLTAIAILLLAWSLNYVCKNLETSVYVANLTRTFISPYFIPVFIFLSSCFISFATGTSWGTLAVLVPIAIEVGSKFSPDVLFLSGAAVLSGSIFGDHISPISDTTIMSSLSSSCDHIDHVSTQAPYGILCAFSSLFFGVLFTSLGFPLILSYLSGGIFLWLFLYIFGKKLF